MATTDQQGFLGSWLYAIYCRNKGILFAWLCRQFLDQFYLISIGFNEFMRSLSISLTQASKPSDANFDCTMLRILSSALGVGEQMVF